MPHLSVKCYELEGRKMICKFRELAVDIRQRDAGLQNVHACLSLRDLIRTRTSCRNGRDQENLGRGRGKTGGRELMLTEHLLCARYYTGGFISLSYGIFPAKYGSFSSFSPTKGSEAQRTELVCLRPQLQSDGSKR